LWDLLESYAKDGLSLAAVRIISRQLLEGVAYMHAKRVIHTDLKPENLALTTPTLAVQRLMFGKGDDAWLQKTLDEPKIKIVDFGNACWTFKHFTDDIQTTQYRAPEVILRSGYDELCDLWSVACVLFELATGDQLFHPESGRGYSKDDDHVTLITELLGPFPREFAKSGKRSKELLDHAGRPKNISKLEFWCLRDVLREKYEVPTEKAEAFSEFLLPMLKISPKERKGAAEMLKKEWLNLQQ